MRRILCFLLVVFPFAAFALTVEPLLKSVWGQTRPFRDECPVNPADPDSGATTPPGCAAVAVAQIHNFYRAFDSAFGTNSYTSTYVVSKNDTIHTPVTIDYAGHTFDFPNIIDSYVKGKYTDAQAHAVADYLYTVGTAMLMQYRPGGSSPINDGSMMWALHHYLRFNPNSMFHYRRFFSTEEWIEMLKNELEAGNPVFYGGGYYKGMLRSGHFWVVDGMESDRTVHANFGTASADNNKYVDIDVFDQRSGTGHFPGGLDVCYNDNNMMISAFTPNLHGGDYRDNGLIVIRPVVLENDSELRSCIYGQGDKFTLGFSFAGYNRDRVTQEYAVGIFKDNELVGIAAADRSPGTWTCRLGPGRYLDVNRKFVMPADLQQGEYEMKFVVKDLASGEWMPFHEAVKATMGLSVNRDQTFSINVPDNHTLPTGLYLAEPIEPISDPATVGKGVLLRFNFINDSPNNFCDTVKIELKDGSKTISYLQHVTVYDHSTPEWHILVPASTGVDASKSYEVSAFYYEHNYNEYLPLTLTPSHVENIRVEGEKDAVEPVRIYRIDGTFVGVIESEDDFPDLGQVSFPAGIYIMRHGSRTRKIKI